MEKTSIIVNEKNTFQINNITYIESTNGQTGLLNKKTNEIIGNMDNFYTICDKQFQFYIQIKKVEYSTNYGYTLRIYDAKEERLIVDGWKLEKLFDEYYGLCSLISPIDGKLHVFDHSICRNSADIFDKAFDEVEFKKLFGHYGESYLLLTVNGKKGIYKQEKGLIIPIEYDEIEVSYNIAILTKDKKKYLVFDEKISSDYEEITIDENNHNIAYCKDGKTFYVYNTDLQELLLKINCEEIKYITILGRPCDYYNYNDGDYCFIYRNKEEYGFVSVKTTYEIRKYGNQKAKVTTLLNANYDDISYEHGIFYIKKNDKVGLLKKGDQDIYIEPIYDKINEIGYNFYAFYNGEYCDISKISSPLKPLITSCKIVEKLEGGLIFKKNNSFGIFSPSNRSIAFTDDKNEYGSHIKYVKTIEEYNEEDYSILVKKILSSKPNSSNK